MILKTAAIAVALQPGITGFPVEHPTCVPWQGQIQLPSELEALAKKFGLEVISLDQNVAAAGGSPTSLAS